MGSGNMGGNCVCAKFCTVVRMVVQGMCNALHTLSAGDYSRCICINDLRVIRSVGMASAIIIRERNAIIKGH